MKKTTALLLSAFLALSITACGNQNTLEQKTVKITAPTAESADESIEQTPSGEDVYKRQLQMVSQ